MSMGYAKTRREAIYRVGLKHELRRRGIGGWKKASSTKRLEKLLRKKR